MAISDAIGEPVSLEPLKESRPSWLKLVKAAARAWMADYAPSMGAALSYYSVFSMAPLLLVVISIAGLVFGEDAVRGEVFGQLQSLLGADAAKAVQAILASVNDKPAQGVLSTVIGLAVLLIGATSVFGGLQDALDRIWRAPVCDRAGGLWGLVRARLLSFGMVLGIAFLLMVSLVMGAAVSALDKCWSGAFAGWELLAEGLNLLIGFALTTGVFAMIYKIMPRVQVQWRDVWVGAVVTALTPRKPIELKSGLAPPPVPVRCSPQEIEVMMKKLLTVVVLALSALSINVAMAHGGAKAKHGGVVAVASDLGFELVGTPTGAAIYVEDHGKPMVPTGMTGKLTVFNGAEKSEAELAVAGDKLEAKGVKLAAGAKVVAALTTPAKKAITVRFTVK